MVAVRFQSQIFKGTDVEHLARLITLRFTHRQLTPLMHAYEVLGDPGEGAGKLPRATLLVATLIVRPAPQGDRSLLELYSLLDPQDDSAGPVLAGPSADRIRRRLAISGLVTREGSGWVLKDPEPTAQEEG